MVKIKKFPFFRQLDYRDCGPTCLRMIAKFYEKNFSREFLRDKASITRQDVTMAGIADAAEIIEMRTLGMRVSLDSLVNEAPTPFIVPWRQKHFVVVYKTSKTKISIALTDDVQNFIKINRKTVVEKLYLANNTTETRNIYVVFHALHIL
jgi:ABC-type bacteriocin/lantibiotic exporter with double-glycine peptidase domain